MDRTSHIRRKDKTMDINIRPIQAGPAYVGPITPDQPMAPWLPETPGSGFQPVSPQEHVEDINLVEEFSKLRRESLEGMMSDCRTYLKSGMSIEDTIFYIHLRRAGSFGINKSVIE